MNKKLTVFLGLVLSITNMYAQLNTTLLGRLRYSPQQTLANIGAYVDPSGNEYALIGTYFGLSIVNVTDPYNPVELFLVPPPNQNLGFSSWKEVKTMGHYAYVSSEGGGGLQIIDLSGLPASYLAKNWMGDGAISGMLNTIHALHIDAGYAYLYGHNIGNRGFVIANLSDPWNPTYAGMYNRDYVHDGYVRNNKVYACEMGRGSIAIVDVTNKATPQIISSFYTPTRFPHNSWLSDDGLTLYTTDELGMPQPYITSWDISNLADVKELDRTFSIKGNGSICHNVHVFGDYLLTAYYKDGITIHDASDPANLIEVGNYDSCPESGSGFFGAWGVYPYLPSGNILISDMDSGLFVISANFVKGCYLHGIITDTVTGLPVGNVNIQILTTASGDRSKVGGDYKTGWGVPGIYDVKYSKQGYQDKIIYGISLTSGVTTIQDVQLSPSGVGVEEELKDDISVFPNPITDSFRVSGLRKNMNYKMKILDISGRMVMHKDVVSGDDGKVFYETDKLSSGIYVLQITNASDNIIMRISVI